MFNHPAALVSLQAVPFVATMALVFKPKKQSSRRVRRHHVPRADPGLTA